MNAANESSHGGYRDDVAAYALGALPDDEAARLREHLESCEECREHLRWLLPAVDLLPRTVPQLRPPRRLRRRLMSTVHAEARSAERERRPAARGRDWTTLLWRPATAVAAGVLLAAGVGAGYLIHQPSGGGSSTLAVHATKRAQGVSGSFVRSGGSGILDVRGMPRLARDQVYEVWLRRGAAVEPASLFETSRDRSGEAAVPGPLGGADAVLVTREPRGGSAQPTSSPLLSVSLH